MTVRHPPDLERLAARQLAELLEKAADGGVLPIDPSSDICNTLELFIPQVLRGIHAEWEQESIDGFFFSRAVKSGRASAELAGTCILISDQAVTPFLFRLDAAADGQLRPLRIRLGERGQGPLGISGPGCNSRAAAELLAGLNTRLDQIDWVYDAVVA